MREALMALLVVTFELASIISVRGEIVEDGMWTGNDVVEISKYYTVINGIPSYDLEPWR